MASPTIRVAVIGDAAQLKNELAGVNQKLGGLQGTADKAGQTLRNVFAAGVVLAGVKRLVGGAAELEQAIGGTATVFGNASGKVDDFSENAATLAGLSERTARTLTSRLGASLIGTGNSAQFAAEKSVELTQIGADLAAALGGTTEEAVTALGAALRGEYDPLERFGIALTATQVNAKAVEMGLAETKDKVDAYGKQQAALNIITEKSALTQGQFARELGTGAGAAAKARADFENAADEIGTSLLPAMAGAAELASGAATAFAGLPQPLQLTALGLVAIRVAGGAEVFTNIANAASGIRVTKDALNGLVTAMKGFSIAAGGLLILQGILHVFANWREEQEKAAESTKAYRDALMSLNPELETVQTIIDELNKTDFDDILGDTDANFMVFGAAIREAGTELDEWADKFGGTAYIPSEFRAALEGASGAAGALGAELLRMVDAGTLTENEARQLILILDTQNDRMDAGAREAATMSSVQEGLTGTTQRSTTAAEENAAAIEELADAYEDAEKAFRDYFELQQESLGIQIDYKNEIADLTEQLKDQMADAVEGNEAHALSLDQDTQAGRDNLEQIMAVREALTEQILQRYNETRSVDDAKQAAIDLTAEYEEQLRQAGLTEQQISDYIATLDLTPENVETAIEVSGLAEANAGLVYMQELMRWIQANAIQTVAPGQTVDISQPGYEELAGIIYQAYQQGGLMAEGGPVTAGKNYIVGEEGPELFVPNASGTIIPHDEAMAYLMGAKDVAGRAAGGPVVRGRPYLVGEEGPEMFTSGTVKTGEGGGMTIGTVNFNVPASEEVAAHTVRKMRQMAYLLGGT